jgi:hypothetical protein
MLARTAILRAAESPRVNCFVSRYGMRLGARRFVPAETLDEIVANVTLKLTHLGIEFGHELMSQRTYSIDPNGDTTINDYGPYTIKDGEFMFDKTIRAGQ